ncbi:hypothetical protein [uncultured Devosia sp.]|uniref:hypothetical protein n=1 Tax=uncultured Devosia sp. TaxID=211434 RepID=UPI00261EFCCE|nr:hypothetical protein [uncultured Devosia sp.]
MSVFKYVISLLALMAIATLAMGNLVASCSLLLLPYGEATVAATATISIDNQEYTGSSIWRVRSQTNNGWPYSGINYHHWVLGDAIEFKIGSGAYVFLRPQTDSAISCAWREHREVEYLAEALSLFTGPCAAEPQGSLTFVTFNPNGTPNFINLAVDPDGKLHAEGAAETSPDIQAIADRGFALLSLTLTATSKPLPDGMVERFPWILDLPRTDVDLQGRVREGYSRRQRGETYMQYFTTDLPP